MAECVWILNWWVSPNKAVYLSRSARISPWLNQMDIFCFCFYMNSLHCLTQVIIFSYQLLLFFFLPNLWLFFLWLLKSSSFVYFWSMTTYQVPSSLHPADLLTCLLACWFPYSHNSYDNSKICMESHSLCCDSFTWLLTQESPPGLCFALLVPVLPIIK